jgi:ribosomal protein S18 acetylase RimI-like enzyme
MLTIRSYRAEDGEPLVALWERCGLVRPNNDPRKDIARKQHEHPEWLLVGLFNDAVIASVMIGYEGHRGWINYLAVCPQYEKRGYGRRLMEEAERLLRAAGCPKINLQVRRTNREVLGFYRAIGYAVDEVVSLGKRLEHDTAS